MKTPAPGRALALVTVLAFLAGCASVPGGATPDAAADASRPEATPPPAAAAAPVPPPAPAAVPAATSASAPAAATAAASLAVAPPAEEAAAPAAQAASAAAPAEPSPQAEPGPPPPRPDPLRTLTSALEEDPDARADLWDRLRNGYAMPVLDNGLVRSWEQRYASEPDYMQRMAERGSRYLFHIVEEVQRRGLPTELALLPFVESAFNPQAMSRARASGMWQFMPATGRVFDLKQNLFRDDRRDVLASTRAALDYLEMLHGMFGDWHLALAAYNWGEGSVKRAQAANRRAGRDTGYEQLHMPAETRNYVPKLQAIANIVRRPQEFGLALPPLENHPYFLTVEIDRDIDVALVTRLAGLTTEQFHQLNPQLNRPVILAAGTPQLLLPYDHANRFLRGLKAHRGPLATWTAWVAPKTLKAAEAARLVGMDEDELREVNRIPPRMLVKTGSTLLVPRTAGRTQDVTEQLADNATLALAPEASPHRRITVRAHRKGETVAALARRVGVPVAALAQWNGVAPGASFRPGHAVTVMVPAKATRVVRAVPSKRAARPASGTRTRVAQQAPPARR